MKHGDISDSLFCLAFAHARDLPGVTYTRKVLSKGKNKHSNLPYSEIPEEEYEGRPYIDNLEVFSFPQTWSSTSLGFGGMGGSAMTIAQTTVVIHERNAAVYFSKQLAYIIKSPNDAFFEDLHKMRMECVDNKEKYYGEAEKIRK